MPDAPAGIIMSHYMPASMCNNWNGGIRQSIPYRDKLDQNTALEALYTRV